jgi:hypothetical protein
MPGENDKSPDPDDQLHDHRLDSWATHERWLYIVAICVVLGALVVLLLR